MNTLFSNKPETPPAPAPRADTSDPQVANNTNWATVRKLDPEEMKVTKTKRRQSFQEAADNISRCKAELSQGTLSTEQQTELKEEIKVHEKTKKAVTKYLEVCDKCEAAALALQTAAEEEVAADAAAAEVQEAALHAKKVQELAREAQAASKANSHDVSVAHDKAEAVRAHAEEKRELDATREAERAAMQAEIDKMKDAIAHKQAIKTMKDERAKLLKLLKEDDEEPEPEPEPEQEPEQEREIHLQLTPSAAKTKRRALSPLLGPNSSSRGQA